MLSDYMEIFVFIEKHSVSDGGGGFVEDWVEGSEFKAGITRDSSTQGKIAEQQGVKDLYTVVAMVNTPLKYNDIIKRKSDNEYFRITTSDKDNSTPSRARIQNKQFSAERYDLNQMREV